MSARTARVSGGGQKRVLYLDFLRAVAPIFVVFIHTAVTLGGQTPRIHVIQEFGRWAVPIFFMISGSLLLNPKKEFSIGTFYRKNVKRLVIALVVWLVLYSCFFTFTGDYEGMRTYYLGFNFFSGCSYHLWFLIAMIGVYILMPLLRPICRERKLLGYAVIAGIIACFALPFLDTIIRMLAFVTDNPFLTGYVNGGMLFGKLGSEVLATFSLVLYFLLGYFLATEEFTKKMRWFIYGLGVVGGIVSLLWIYVGEKIMGIPIASSYYSLSVLCFSGALFLAARYGFEKVKKLPWIVGFMAKNSFGVYLCHLAIVIIFTEKIGWFNDSAMMIIAASLAVYLISLIISWLLSKIPLVRKIV